MCIVVRRLYELQMLTTAVDSVEHKVNSPVLVIVLKDFRHLVMEFPGPEEAQDISDALHLLSRPGQSLFPLTWAHWICHVLWQLSSLNCMHLPSNTHTLWPCLLWPGWPPLLTSLWTTGIAMTTDGGLQTSTEGSK